MKDLSQHLVGLNLRLKSQLGKDDNTEQDGHTQDGSLNGPNLYEPLNFGAQDVHQRRLSASIMYKLIIPLAVKAFRNGDYAKAANDDPVDENLRRDELDLVKDEHQAPLEKQRVGLAIERLVDDAHAANENDADVEQNKGQLTPTFVKHHLTVKLFRFLRIGAVIVLV